MDVTIVARGSPTATEAASVAAIYEASFPPSDRDDTCDLLASFHDGRRVCHIATVAGRVAGFAAVMPLRGAGVPLLDYLAVAEDMRSRGIGSRILQVLRSDLREDPAGAAGFPLEVDRPDLAAGAERDLRTRRIAMYGRNGACVVDCAPDYRAPAAAGGLLGHTLMWLPATNAPAPRGELLRRCVTAILVESYGLRPSDPLIAAVVAGMTC